MKNIRVSAACLWVLLSPINSLVYAHNSKHDESQEIVRASIYEDILSIFHHSRENLEYAKVTLTPLLLVPVLVKHSSNSEVSLVAAACVIAAITGYDHSAVVLSTVGRNLILSDWRNKKANDRDFTPGFMDKTTRNAFGIIGVLQLAVKQNSPWNYLTLPALHLIGTYGSLLVPASLGMRMHRHRNIPAIHAFHREEIQYHRAAPAA